MEINIGNKIRELRRTKNMTINDLAKNSKLSSGLISQIERNIVSPTIVTLWKISQALDVSIGYLLDEAIDRDKNWCSVIRKSERKKLIVSNNNGIYELLSPNLNKKIEFLYITIKPGDSLQNELIVHDGEECGYIIEGKLLIKTAKGDFALNEGDSIYFDSTVPHRYVNIGEVDCISVWAMTPPSF
ncbi:MAG: cupin domain-containing protein [Tissierellales bacterium]|nr:cupin domain-containing protein [Tissierellales bacterium]